MNIVESALHSALAALFLFSPFLKIRISTLKQLYDRESMTYFRSQPERNLIPRHPIPARYGVGGETTEHSPTWKKYASAIALYSALRHRKIEFDYIFTVS